MNYTLYKNPISFDTLYIVQYLYKNNIDMRPKIIIERNWPQEVTELPSIKFGNELYIGFEQVVDFYQKYSGIQDLVARSKEFREVSHKDYRIN
jgi:hypothetical protein